ncbi:MAG: DUF4038 domain-containing protein [Verrucomicrobia bacterium]|nr:DUF4038 domain-containing protein [Verrucomicrobiota bacterium]
MAARLQSDTQRTWLILLALTLIYALSVAAATQWPLQISADGRSLEERDGAPHFPIIDTVWQLSYLNQPDVDLYLSRRPAQGFNAVFVSLLGVENLPHGHNSTNDNGHMPFAGSVGAPDTRRPNPAFFDDFKATLRKLREKNMTVFLVLGWASAWQESFSRESYRRYVEFVLGAYPADEFPHVVFCLGGDKGMLRQKNLDKPMQIEAGRHLRQLMNARGDRRLLSDHPGRGSTIINYAPEERAGWSDILVVQSGHRAPTQDVPDWVRQAYEASPAAPVFNGEPLYEAHNPGLENAEVRWAHWVSVFSGACAVGYGGHGFWGIGADVPARPTRPGHSRDWWKAHLEDQPVASQVRHFAALNQAYPFHLAAPDFALNQPLVQHRGQGAAYTAALVAKDRSWALAYLPQQPGIAEVALRMDALRAPARLRWFDPTSGAFKESAERIPNRGIRLFKAPGNNGAGQRDWVLALEAAPW